MRTLIFIGSGLALLALLALVALPSPPAWRNLAAAGFALVWLAVSVVDFGIGLAHGNPVREERLVHAALFGVPAAAALAWAWLGRRT